MASNQSGPHIPSKPIASQLEKPKVDPPQVILRQANIDARPGPVILSQEQANALEKPLSKEELKKKAEEMNK
jgi:hypothetical protein